MYYKSGYTYDKGRGWLRGVAVLMPRGPVRSQLKVILKVKQPNVMFMNKLILN